MKKFLALFFSLTMMIMITACDQETALTSDSALLVGSIAGNNHTYPEIQKLAGTSWQLVDYDDLITRTETATGGITTTDTVTELFMSRHVYTITFNRDGTYSCLHEWRYLPEWDAQYVDSGNIDYSANHQSTTPGIGAYTGYSNQYCDGYSYESSSGLWVRRKVTSIIDNEDNYTWMYEIKEIRQELRDYSVTETAQTYQQTAVDITIDINDDEDTDWDTDAVLLEATGKSDGNELRFNFAAPISTVLLDGVYTKI